MRNKMRYRLIQLKDKTAFLKEDEVKKLITRFDPNQKYQYCVLCSKYPFCRGCPVVIFGDKDFYGCEYLAKQILGEAGQDIRQIARLKFSLRQKEALKIKEWFMNLPKYELKEIK